MADIFSIKQGDTLPVLRATIYEPGGSTPTGLHDCTVILLIRDTGGDTLLSAECSIIDAAQGRVEYQWQAGDTETVGVHRGEFRVIHPSGIATVPNRGHFLISVTENIRVVLDES